ncbi:hypothetical protein [Nocardia arthritidis]|uniref:HK97 gp10 family phage protein n=1 Tax=Nocardia arthritidis TaxID=228602 RepID=A0A6G9YU20_9NOCA|nr:hypothetical protein [Nocardia arthritidis]QIS16496.1 hypothetical protein F5544_43460 [Nocardia arthritidis]
MDVQIQFKSGAFKKLRSEPGVAADLERRAKRYQQAAEAMDGGKYKVYSQQGKAAPQGRWRTSVTTGDPRTIRKNAKHHTLLKALDAARQ